MNYSIRKAFSILPTVLFELILIWLLSGLPCLAQGIPTSQVGPTDPQELEVFLDKFFAQQMSKEHVPGAVFALVKDGKIFFSKGYGYADLEKKIPVVPDKTLFRVGSISKLFTATAVMQLAEQNKLKLDDDVNKYLKRFQIENSYNKPVTFANLLTHTDGFDSGWGIGAFARSASEMTPLGDFIAKRLPPRIMPPGEVFLYSDVGMNLAGYLVEVISGIPFAKYVDQNILQPLNMRRSSFFQPLPPQLAPDLAVGYKYKNGTYQRRPFAFSNTIPGNALMATATDIAQFAIAHLQNGRYGEARILNEATAQEMHRQHFAHYPGMVGSAYGFYHKQLNKQRAILHSGRHSGYTTQLYLLPDQNLGFFVSCNNNPTSLPDELVKQFFDHYYPVKDKPAPIPQRIASSQEHLQKLSGTYRYNRYPHHTVEKLAAVFGEAGEIRAFAGKDSTLSLYVPEYKSVEVKPLLFRFLYSNDRMTFRKDDRGRITHMFISDSVFAALEKLAWYETNDFQLKLLIFCTLVFFSACIVQLISWLVRRIRKPGDPPKSPLTRGTLTEFSNLRKKPPFIGIRPKSPFTRGTLTEFSPLVKGGWGGSESDRVVCRHALVRLIRKRVSKGSKLAQLAQLLTVLVSTLNLVFLIGIGLVLYQADFWELFFGLPTVAIALLYIPPITTGLTFLLPILIVLTWKHKYWSGIERLHYILITLAAIGFVSFLDYWNLLGFRF